LLERANQVIYIYGQIKSGAVLYLMGTWANMANEHEYLKSLILDAES